MKLQDAYVAETGVYVGNWTKIGYTMGNTTVFTYDDIDLKTGTNGTTSIVGLSGKVGWQAKAIAALNDCPKDATWSIKVSGNSSSGGAVTYEAVYSAESKCDPLTPSFKKLTR